MDGMLYLYNIKTTIMEKYLIHSNELHLIEQEKIHQAVEQMVETLEMAAGSTYSFDLYKVVETYFKDLENRREIHMIRKKVLVYVDIKLIYLKRLLLSFKNSNKRFK